MPESINFVQLILGVLTLVSAVFVVGSKNAIVSAVSLMATLFLTGGLYFGLGSYFIGTAQILIYAGAVAVLFVFIVMLLDLKPLKIRIPGRVPVFLGVMAAGLLFFVSLLAAVIPSKLVQNKKGEFLSPEQWASISSALSISELFVSKYMLAFQVTGVLILGAIIGVIYLGLEERSQGA